MVHFFFSLHNKTQDRASLQVNWQTSNGGTKLKKVGRPCSKRKPLKTLFKLKVKGKRLDVNNTQKSGIGVQSVEIGAQDPTDWASHH